MKLVIEIELGNDAMQDGYDAYQAIAQSNIPHHRGNHPDEGSFSDANGNTVGSWSITETERTPKSGDHCRILPGSQPRVQHWDCDEFPDGTITNPITGQVI